MKRALAATLTAGLLAASPASAQEEGSLQGPLDGPPACSLVTTAPAPRVAVAWVQCNFRVTHLTVRSSAAIERVRPSPRLHGADGDDRLTCERSARRRAGCSGSLGAFVRPRIRLRLRRPTCDDPPLRVRVTATGGLDCPPDEACPDIGLVTRARSDGALGCA